MAIVDYDHQANRGLHTVEGAAEILRAAFADVFPASVLDMGCGTGTWLRASLDRGATEVLGIDGSEIRDDLLFVPKGLTRRADLRQPLDLGRRFELVICVEIAEHLEAQFAPTLIDMLVRHGDHVLFSAAAPGQGGIGHSNCQWPDYWQALFNDRGYACSDELRWRIWRNSKIEPWYRQNLMIAARDSHAGLEPRVQPVIHPDLLPSYFYGLQQLMAGRDDFFERPWWR